MYVSFLGELGFLVEGKWETVKDLMAVVKHHRDMYELCVVCVYLRYNLC